VLLTIATASWNWLSSTSTGGWAWIGELLLALTLVAAAGDHGPDVVVQVTGQVQNQVADAVAEGEGFGPERPGGHRMNEVVDPMGQVLEIAGKLIAG